MGNVEKTIILFNVCRAICKKYGVHYEVSKHPSGENFINVAMAKFNCLMEPRWISVRFNLDIDTYRNESQWISVVSEFIEKSAIKLNEERKMFKISNPITGSVYGANEIEYTDCGKYIYADGLLFELKVYEVVEL